MPVSAATNVDATGTQRLGIGDTVIVSFQDVIIPIPPVDQRVREDGTITLIYSKKFTAVGKTAKELEEDIRKVYVPGYFKEMTPTVKTADSFFYVGGEVKAPGRQVYLNSDITVLRAINAAGGFTDFANKRKIEIIRASGTAPEWEDCKEVLKHPEKDLKIFPGDSVVVHPSMF
jgi:polysaccharide export outer membrane protein